MILIKLKAHRGCHTGILLLIAIFFLLNLKSIAQDNAPVKFGKVKVEDFTLNSPVIDSNSNAVVVLDKGEITFEGNQKGWFSYIFKKTKRIKIINNKGFDLATVKLLLYQDGQNKEKVENLNGTTYNEDNGTITETRLSSGDFLDEKFDKNHFYKKFALPAIKAGCIIEYSYTIKSDFIFNIPAWEFQSAECPTLWSEFSVNIPGLLTYMSSFQGSHKYYIDKSGEGFKVYSVSRVADNGGALTSREAERLAVSTQTILHRWVMKDVPTFNVENYISSPSNFIDKIRFQLSKTYDGETYHDVANNWEKVTEELMKREDFGEPLVEENNWLDKIVEPLLQNNDNTLQKAQKIYYYIQKNYSCVDHYDKYIKTSLQDVVKKKSGTVGDLNLLLIAMLKHEKIEASPVLLSTREFGWNSPTYPLMEKLNYVISRTKINSRDYYLDATIPFLPFGKLPLNCYNGHARVIASDTTAVYFEPDSLKENSRVSLFIFNNDNKEMDGTFAREMGFFESLDARTNIDKSDLQAYEKKIKSSYPEDISLSDLKIDSLDLIEYPVSLKFNFKLSFSENSDIIYFNPFMGEAVKENPFYAAERMYPVEMPYKTHNTYTLNMEIPKGYKVDELPKSSRALLNDKEGMFEYLISADANNIQMRCILEVNKATFSSEDYQTLRDFYALIVKKEAEQIVFKKIN